MADDEKEQRPPHFLRDRSASLRLLGGSLTDLIKVEKGEEDVDVTGDVGTQQVRLLGKIHAAEKEHVFVSRLKGFTSRHHLDVCFFYFN